MKKTDNYSIDGAIFLPIEVAQKQFGLKKIGSIEIYVKDILHIEKTKKQAYFILSKYFPNDTDKIFHFQTNEQIIKEIEKTTNSFAYFIIGIASISLFV
jgi:ABC-type antimicrobial peptide transport system permease subunit